MQTTHLRFFSTLTILLSTVLVLPVQSSEFLDGNLFQTHFSVSKDKTADKTLGLDDATLLKQAKNPKGIQDPISFLNALCNAVQRAHTALHKNDRYFEGRLREQAEKASALKQELAALEAEQLSVPGLAVAPLDISRSRTSSFVGGDWSLLSPPSSLPHLTTIPSPSLNGDGFLLVNTP